jgi:transcription initiation factor TFIID TATA-box-binding protein
MATTLARADDTDTRIQLSINIQNVSTIATFGHFLNLDEIAASLPRVKADPEKHPGVIYHHDDPEATLVMFSKGTMLVFSARNEAQAIEAIRKTVQVLRDRRIRVNPDPDISVRNVMATATINSRINLELASMTLERTVYEPQHFPGLFYRPVPGISMCLFGQGKMTITGTQNESEVEAYVEETVKRLTELGCMEE